MEMLNLNPIPFENVEIVSGVPKDAVPSGEAFAGKSQPFSGGAMPWDLSSFTGPESDAKCLLLRMNVTIPENGCYVFAAGADYFFKVWFDGVLCMDRAGHWFPDPLDHLEIVSLKKGTHKVEISFARGSASAKLNMGLYPVSDFPQYGTGTCSADLSRTTGRLRKELHGANTTLLLSDRYHKRYENQLLALNFTYARTHDWALWNPGQRIIDTHFVFPLMHLDPKDPANYYFDATDEIIRMTQDLAGLKVFYRLGTSIEHTGEKHFNIIPPKDPEKYAEVLAGIVRHYTKGWANGFHYDIRYWEIWNEPNGTRNMWPAPLSEFIPLFVTVLKRLKKEFPELKIGGPAIGGYAPELFQPILDACKKEGIAPDFISWHTYTEDPGFLVRQPERMRRFLDEQGFRNTELCINEWHYLEDWTGVLSLNPTPEEFRNAVIDGPRTLQGINSGVFNLAVLAGWQDSPLDTGMYYGAGWENPSFGFKTLFREYSKNYWSMHLFGKILREYPVKCSSVSGTHTYLLAVRSEDGSRAGILAADYKGTETTIGIAVKGVEKYRKVSAVILDRTRNNEPVPVTLKDGVLTLQKAEGGSAAFFVTFENQPKGKTT